MNEGKQEPKKYVGTGSYLTIKDWPSDERPREKMMAKGQAALSDAELIAILLQTGTANRSALDLARELLTLAKNDLNVLSRFTLKEFQQVKGIGMAKAVTLAAVLELGRRRQMSKALERLQFSTSRDVASFLIPMLQDKTHEVFCVLYVNNAGRLIHHEFISSGGVTATVVDIKMILKSAIQLLATRIIVAHNHPSGNLRPSKSDIDLTEKLKKAAKTVDIQLIDHIIVAENSYLSFADESLL